MDAKSTQQTGDPSKSVKTYMIGAGVLIAVLFGGIGGWAAMANIAGAVFAQGELIIEGRSHQVQHPDGGIIERVAVRDGDAVAKDDVLFVLDPTRLQASHAILTMQVAEHHARRARLRAERDGAGSITFPEFLSRSSNEDVLDLVLSEEALFDARQVFLDGQTAQLRQRIVQIHDEIAGLDSQRQAKIGEIALIGEELDALQRLLDQGLVENSRVLALRRAAAQLNGAHGAFEAQIAQAQGQISETQMQILSMANDHQTQVLTELNQTTSRLAELTEELGDVTQRMDRLVVRAPLAGIVHELALTSQGALVSAERTVLQIVPVQNLLIIEARITPQDIDQVAIGSQATLRFSAFNQRTTPELTGTVTHLSADRSVDDQSGAIWYTARLSVTDEEIARLGDDIVPLPGMPVDVLIQTSERTVLSFLVKPITDHIARAFIEE
jgi:HlyD family secretion protein